MFEVDGMRDGKENMAKGAKPISHIDKLLFSLFFELLFLGFPPFLFKQHT